jgi:hypothetical protein
MSRVGRPRMERGNERSNEREMVSLGETSAFNLPREFLEKHPDKSFCFVPYLCGGKELVEDYYTAVHDRKFSVALAADYPELARRLPHFGSLFSQREDEQLIKVKGQVLMVRSIEDKIAEDKKYDEQNARQEHLNSYYRMNPQNPAFFADDRRFQTHG